MNNLTETLREKFRYDEPIFTYEILELYPQYTESYVFRLIKEAEDEGGLKRMCSGVYYVPIMTKVGLSLICPDDVVTKRYMRSNGKVYGIYGGIALQNLFSVTNQMTITPEIITNNTSSNYKEIFLKGRKFFLCKSRTEITKENEGLYCILQLFTERNGLKVGEDAKQRIKYYMKDKKITKSALVEFARFFPPSTLKNLLYGGVV
ncbi:MAG: hypothetical protein LUD47_05755 [Clostridia bacterium]|nr:hypothetical protein [Clostridia bacterium]